MKENIKLINGKLAALLYPDTTQETSGKKKSKKSNKQSKNKIDFCYYDKSIDNGESIINQLAELDEMFEKLHQAVGRKLSDDEEEHEEEDEEHEQEDHTRFMNMLCIIDRRKCSRHNGWWNLAYDELSTRLDSLEDKVKLLKQQRTDVLRSYSINQYEKVSS